jgi:hypothetical protein
MPRLMTRKVSEMANFLSALLLMNWWENLRSFTGVWDEDSARTNTENKNIIIIIE